MLHVPRVNATVLPFTRNLDLLCYVLMQKDILQCRIFLQRSDSSVIMLKELIDAHNYIIEEHDSDEEKAPGDFERMASEKKRSRDIGLGQQPIGKRGRAAPGKAAIPNGKRWCFTVNNPCEEEIAEVKEIGENGEHEAREYFSALCVGLECGDSGTVHLQGYFELRRKSRMSGIKKAQYWLQRAHLEIARGSPVQASEYCRKEGKVLADFGIFRDSERGSAALLTLKSVIDDGGTLKDCFEKDFATSVRYTKGLSMYANNIHAASQERSIRCVAVFWGPPGTGKSREAAMRTRDKPTYWSTGERWFDGYAGEECIIFDDYDGDISYRILLRILDRYPFRVPYKGGFFPIRAVEFYFTSNKPFTAWYPAVYESTSADPMVNPLVRRITEIKEF